MLFGYPIEANEENWLHDCLVDILHAIHWSLINNENPTVWPEIIPEACREKLRYRRGLMQRLATYQTAAETLNVKELVLVDNALVRQNDIELLLSDTDHNCETIDQLPENIRVPARDLFKFSFGLLSSMKIRDRQYQIIYESSTYHVCPFCGCEYFDAPGAPREALDHYLPESKYPFAAANLHNLVPMGNKCNSRYKLAQDILYNGDGNRRVSFFPFDRINEKISLTGSKPFENEYCEFPLPLWSIDFDPDCEQAETWDSVFHIRERYKRDILDSEFRNWLREFSSWCNSAEINPCSEQEIIGALKVYAEYMGTNNFRDRAFLKSAMFEMLYTHCVNGHQRLITLIIGVVIGGMQ